MRVIVTRVQPQALHWAQLLEARGHQSYVLPLIETRALADASLVSAAWSVLADYVAVMFVSSQSVECFYASKPPLGQFKYRLDAIKIRYWGPGPGTRAALLAQGVAADLVDSPPAEGGQYDSEALWQQVQNQIQPGVKVLIVRGDTLDSQDLYAQGADQQTTRPGAQGVGREWLAQCLRQAGAQVDFLVAYQRAAPVWSPAEFALAQAGAADGSLWLFSSAEALLNLQQLLPKQSWRCGHALVTHPRIAEVARRLGFGVVSQSRPDRSSVLASIESLA